MAINNITQTISTIPQAGKRGVDIQTVFVIKQEDFQDHLQGKTVGELNTLKTQMNTMAEAMNTTASQVNTNANTATTQAGIATTKASEASASATSASTSASTASTKASQASTSATTASTKASEASASATSASASATTATTKASEASASATTASTKASEASASATSASQSLDSINGILATLPDGSINDTLLGTDKAFSNQALVGSFGNLSSPLLDLPLKNSLTMKAGVGSTTFTRASTATYINRYGVLKTAGIDEPRFEKEGYLNEGSSTNLFLYSIDLTNANILKANTTVNVALDESIDGVSSFLVRENTNTSTHTIYQSINFTSGTTYTLSIYVKAKERNVVQIDLPDSHFPAFSWLKVNLNNGTVLDKASILTDDDVLIKPLGKGWYRISVTATADVSGGGNISCRLCLSDGTSAYMGDGNSGLYVASPQLEALPFASSYIPTTDSAVTRTITNNSITFYNNVPDLTGKWSIAMNLVPLENITTTKYLYGNYIDSNNYVRIGAATSNRFFIGLKIAGIEHYTIVDTNSGYIIGGSYQLIIVYENGKTSIYINGSLKKQTSNSKFSTTFPSVSAFYVGSAYPTLGHLQANIKNFKIYDKALTPTEIALLG